MRGASPRVRRLALVAAVVAVVLALALPASAATVVKLTNTNRYKPGTAQIAKGGRIKWNNVSSRKHNVVAYGGWSYKTTLPSGDTAVRRFTTKGTFKYRCTIGTHSNLSGGNCTGMCGTIKVG
ncbi:MAG: hypothetical protein WD206_01220 [Actinomycetota bacterium]